MAVKTFAAIDVGSFELSMKIFEVSKNGMKEIDHVRHEIDMGTESYTTGKLSYERVDELCRVLCEFAEIMKGYQVSDYVAYGTSAIRETTNTTILLNQIEVRTGIHIEVLSNSEQRFLDYKSIAFQGEGFLKIIENGTAIVDVGGGSIQISLFDKDTLVSTQNMRLGVLRLQEWLNQLNASAAQCDDLVNELVDSQMTVYKKLYLRDREIKNIIVVDDYISVMLRKKNENQTKGYAGRDLFERFEKDYHSKSTAMLAKRFDMPEESMPMLHISMILLRRIMETMDAELIWTPGVTLCDGIAYEYAEKNKIITSSHDFEQDIIACAQNISRRYRGSRRRSETLEQIALTIFDSTRKIHGLGKRERLLLQLSTILHDCGKYISMANLGECSYSIIMATEIIGLSHREREIVANTVKYNHLDFVYYEKMVQDTTLDREAYLVIAKLTAILRLANGLDRSHKQKFKNVKTTLKDDELIITISTDEDITLEKGLFGARAAFFREVYNVRPVIRQKRMIGG
jgi:exopolyphosphatase/guanosine-5'-triphosphate,3'-diphosphate pyrophosphatase